MKILKYFEKLSDWIAKFESLFLVFILLLMLSLSILQILMRNFFQVSISGIEIMNRSLVVVLTFVSASLATHYQRHIIFDLLIHRLSLEKRRVVNLVNYAFCIAVCMFFIQASYQFIQREYLAESILVWGIPHYYFELAILYGFFMMIFRWSVYFASDGLSMILPSGNKKNS